MFGRFRFRGVVSWGSELLGGQIFRLHNAFRLPPNWMAFPLGGAGLPVCLIAVLLFVKGHCGSSEMSQLLGFNCFGLTNSIRDMCQMPSVWALFEGGFGGVFGGFFRGFSWFLPNISC